jgi:hypothetical protein
LNGNGATDLIRTISNISFTQLVTFGRRYHSLPYSIFCASPWGLHSNVTFPEDSQVGVPKMSPKIRMLTISKLLTFVSFSDQV